MRKRAGVVGAATGVVLGGRPGLTRKPFARRIPYNVARALTLTCTLNPTPNPRPRLNAGSKPKAEHTLQILPKPLSTTTPQGEEGPTPHPTGEGRPHAERLTFCGQASGVPSPPHSPPPMVWSGTGWGGGGWRVRRGVGAVGAAAGETARRHRQGRHSTQALRKP